MLYTSKYVALHYNALRFIRSFFQHLLQVPNVAFKILAKNDVLWYHPVTLGLIPFWGLLEIDPLGAGMWKAHCKGQRVSCWTRIDHLKREKPPFPYPSLWLGSSNTLMQGRRLSNTCILLGKIGNRQYDSVLVWDQFHDANWIITFFQSGRPYQFCLQTLTKIQYLKHAFL